MKETTRKSKIALLLAFATVVAILIGSPTMSAATTMMTLTGTILPPGHEKEPNNYVLKYQGQTSVFRIKNAHVLYGGGNSGPAWSILNGMHGRKITVLGGDKEAIRALTELDTLCKGVRLYGTLNQSKGALVLAAVELAPKEDQPAICQ